MRSTAKQPNNDNNDSNNSPADLGQSTAWVCGDDREISFLFQSSSVLLFQLNSLLLHVDFDLVNQLEH